MLVILLSMNSTVACCYGSYSSPAPVTSQKLIKPYSIVYQQHTSYPYKALLPTYFRGLYKGQHISHVPIRYINSSFHIVPSSEAQYSLTLATYVARP